jgi:membrane-bound lytic murein transglycosylase D
MSLLLILLLATTVELSVKAQMNSDAPPAAADTSESEEEEGLPALMQSDPTGGVSSLLTSIDVLSAKEAARAVPWRPPDFTGQTGALGWHAETFEIPEGLKDRVAFWREIYSRFTTDQGVLHDASHIDIVYETVDFTPIMRDTSLSLREKHQKRESFLKERKKAIVDRLMRLQAWQKSKRSPSELSGEDLRVWKMFAKVQDSNKFKVACDKKHLRFQLGQKDRFLLGLFYSGRYMREMERIFRAEGLPIELTRLPFVESSFNIHARSKVGASGIWQFMPRTAKAYMTVSKHVDERNDPLRATVASARLLKQNYLMLGSWPLALTGYNHGPYGVRGIVNKLGTSDLAEIIARYSSKSFGFASENFYACFLAALQVEKNARTYFGDVKWSGEIQSQEVRVSLPLPFSTLVEFYDGDRETAEMINSHLQSPVRDGKIAIPRGTYVRVPPERAALASDFMSGKVATIELGRELRARPWKQLTQPGAIVEAANKASTSKPQVAQEVSPIRERLEKLSATAAAVFPILTGQAAATPAPQAPPAEPSPSVTADAPVVSPVEAQPTPDSEPQVFSLADVKPDPMHDSKIDSALEAQSEPQLNALPVTIPKASKKSDLKPAKLTLKTYRVRPGDSLQKIAARHGIALNDLREANGIKTSSTHRRAKRDVIRTGQVLKLPSAKSGKKNSGGRDSKDEGDE